VPETPQGTGAGAAAPEATATASPWVVLPTYNEAENLERIVGAVLDHLPASSKILIVDDNSPDGTGEIAARLAESSESISVLHRERKEGLGPAYLAGFRVALSSGADLIIEMDADFSHDPAYLPELIAAAENADLVIGSRYVDGGGVEDWGPLRRFISRGGSAYARMALGLPIRDLTGGFKCFRREVLEAIGLESIEARGYAFQVETTYRAIKSGFRVVEMPIVFRDRREGSSKMSKSIVAEAIWRVPAMRFRRR
jgi:dolichol-phosphate mannosyltransferase